LLGGGQEPARCGWLRHGERVVLFNTAAGYKYAEGWRAVLEA
jgi:hypothetical protein